VLGPRPHEGDPVDAERRHFVDFTGFRFGPDNCYEFEKYILEGGMGQIWAAAHRHPDGKQRVAVKIIRPDRKSEFSTQLFAREIRMHARVADIPGVVRLLDHGCFIHQSSDEPVQYIVLEWIKEAAPLTLACAGKTWAERVAIFARVCEILALVHERGIVHCDIKPHNILANLSGEVFLTDFGLAIAQAGPGSESYGREINAIRGTWAYMTPEQCKPGCDPHHFTPALDVYALSVTFYECLTGQLPYKLGATAMDGSQACKNAIAAGAKIRRRRAGRTLPPSLTTALRTAANPDQRERPKDAAAFGRMLRPLIVTSPIREYATYAAALALTLVLGWFGFTPLIYESGLNSYYMSALPPPVLGVDQLDCARVIVTQQQVEQIKAASHPSIGENNYERRAAIAAVVEMLRAANVKCIAVGVPLAAFPLRADPSDSIFGEELLSEEDAVPLRAVNASLRGSGKSSSLIILAQNNPLCPPDELSGKTWPPDQRVVGPQTLVGTYGCHNFGLMPVFIPAALDASGKVVPSLPLLLAAHTAFAGDSPTFSAPSSQGPLVVTNEGDAAVPPITVKINELPWTTFGELLVHSADKELDRDEYCSDEANRNVAMLHLAAWPSAGALSRSTKKAEELMAMTPSQVAAWCNGRPILIAIEGEDTDPPLTTGDGSKTTSQVLQTATHYLLHHFRPLFGIGPPPILTLVPESYEATANAAAAIIAVSATRRRNRRGKVPGAWWPVFITVIPLLVLVFVCLSALFYHNWYTYWNPLPMLCIAAFAIVLTAYLPWWRR